MTWIYNTQPLKLNKVKIHLHWPESLLLWQLSFFLFFCTGRLQVSFWSNSHSEKCLPFLPWWEVTGEFLDLLAHCEPVSSKITPPILHRSTGTSANEFQFSPARGWEGSGWRPLLVTLVSRWMGEVEGGTDTRCSWINDDFSGAFNFGRPACIATENLPDKWASRGYLTRKTALPG